MLIDADSVIRPSSWQTKECHQPTWIYSAFPPFHFRISKKKDLGMSPLKKWKVGLYNIIRFTTLDPLYP